MNMGVDRERERVVDDEIWGNNRETWTQNEGQTHKSSFLFFSFVFCEVRSFYFIFSKISMSLNYCHSFKMPPELELILIKPLNYILCSIFTLLFILVVKVNINGHVHHTCSLKVFSSTFKAILHSKANKINLTYLLLHRTLKMANSVVV